MRSKLHDKVMVSICCITYNHENYIADAIESFLMQETTFKYEILIHDDASTDKTADIIRDYEKLYPDLIKPIYQKENQYSKGVRRIGLFNLKRSSGKYIAICEGDDYWTDSKKLQKQFEYMENHPDCSACVHAANNIDAKTNKIIGAVRPNQSNKIFSVEEVILGGGSLFATNSMIYRSKFRDNLPEFYQNSPVGDYPRMIYLSLKGAVYYIDELMSAHRTGVKDSWTTRTHSNLHEYLAYLEKKSIMLEDVNKYTNFKYDTVIRKTIRKDQFRCLMRQGKFKEASKDEFKELYSSYIDSLSLKSKTKIFLFYHFPQLHKYYIRSRSRIARCLIK